MHKFLSFIKEFRIPKKIEFKKALDSFSKREFYVLSLIIIVATTALFIALIKLNNKFLVAVPSEGGSITEGIVGMPTLVNPVLAMSDADKDLTSLVYSGLMRKDSNGNFINDLADSYTISPDGLSYTFTIKKKATFHDGTKLTADDVVFTINKIKDGIVKSPKRIGWDSINVEKADDMTVVFKLKQPNISFLDNTTIGILPSHIWSKVNDSQWNISSYNIKAIGSGPYKVNSVVKNSDGIPEKYVLKRFSNFTLGIPHIKNITIISYSNEKEILSALSSGAIDQAGGISPKNAENFKNNYHTINTAETPRIFGIFYNNANNKIFADINVVKAINYALDRQAIVDQVLYGYGTSTDSPIPSTILENNTKTQNDIDDAVKKATDLLDKNGWTLKENGIRSKGGTTIITKTKKVGKKIITEKVKVNNGSPVELAFSLTTGDTPELRHSTEIIKEQLGKIGIKVDITKVYEMGPLNQIIKNREYEALFFGQIINHESDLYSFWHSSQRKSPGLNISMYNNAKVDKILEETQKIMDEGKRKEKYKVLIDEFNKDLPALLVYSPKFLYITSNKINNLNLNILTNPADRFASVYLWYANTDYVWKIFTKLQ